MDGLNKTIIPYYNTEDPHIILYKKYGRLHREDGPAKIIYYKHGTKSYEEYLKNGESHREDGPAYVEYDPDGLIRDCIFVWKGERVGFWELFDQVLPESQKTLLKNWLHAS